MHIKILVSKYWGEALSFKDAQFDTALCIGSFGPGHAPPSSLTELCRVVRSGGHVIYNVVEHTYVDQGFPEVSAELEATGAWNLIADSGPFRAYSIGEPDLYTRMFIYQVS